MDTQRTVLWVIFSVSLLFLWNNWQAYNGRPPLFGGSPQTQQPSPGTAAGKPDASVPSPAAPAVTAPGTTVVPAAPAAEAAPAAKRERVTVTTDQFRIDFDTLGAQIVRSELLEHRDSESDAGNMTLLETTPERTYVAQSGVIGAPEGTPPYPNHRTPFKVVTPERTMTGNMLAVRFEAESGGVKVAKTFTFTKGSHLIAVNHEVTNVGPAPVAPQLYLQLTRDNNPMKGQGNPFGLSTYTGPVVYTEEKKFQKVDFSDIEKDKASFVKKAPDVWFGIIQHYFVSAWEPADKLDREYYASRVEEHLFRVGSKMPLGSLAPGASVTNESRLFVGPQDQDALAKVAPGLDLVVDYGWLTMIAKPLFWLLQWLHGIVPNWGWAIMLLTLIVKALLYPLASAGFKSMARMKKLTPRMTKLREQYGDDRQKMNLAMMELYKTEKINPFGGCLPIVVQIPVFIALYWVILASVELRGAPWWGWIHDLSVHDPWYILPAFMTASMFLQTKMNPPPPDPIQAKVMTFMPLVFGAMMFLFPSGLVLYWCVNNVLSITQQWWITRQLEKAGLK
jgi:YidC/Oxa1 family membrane protein insertase